MTTDRQRAEPAVSNWTQHHKQPLYVCHGNISQNQQWQRASRLQKCCSQVISSGNAALIYDKKLSHLHRLQAQYFEHPSPRCSASG
eukprot:5163569-Amphidinium_carterae.1